MKIKENCIKTAKDKKVVCEENKRKITFLNPAQQPVEKIKVDGCQIVEGVKCDFLVRYDKHENFIELKGSDINHAIKQLKRTIKLLGQNDIGKRISYIISSRCPLAASEIQHLRKKLRSELRSDLIVKNNNFETRI